MPAPPSPSAELRRTQRSVVVDDALGSALLRAGAPRQALVFARRALGSAPAMRRSCFTAAPSKALGRRPKAAHDLRRALTLNPHSPSYEAQARRLLEEVSR